ncbi:MAG: hypothetical protein RR923_07105, partial [Bacilli bacterium]
STKYSMQEKDNDTQELDNSSFSLKEKQLEKLNKIYPTGRNVTTGIKSVKDIKTFEETLQDSDYKKYYETGEDFDETYSANMARKGLKEGKITVYSSSPISQGIFVTPSKKKAKSYLGNGEDCSKEYYFAKVLSKEVDLKDVAWINPTQGYYVKVDFDAELFNALTYIEKEEVKRINKEIKNENIKANSVKSNDIEKEKAKKKVIELKQRKLDIYNGNLKVDKTVPLTKKSVYKVSFDENELNKDNTLDEQVQRLINIVNDGIDTVDNQSIDEAIEEIKYYKDHYINQTLFKKILSSFLHMN